MTPLREMFKSYSTLIPLTGSGWVRTQICLDNVYQNTSGLFEEFSQPELMSLMAHLSLDGILSFDSGQKLLRNRFVKLYF